MPRDLQQLLEDTASRPTEPLNARRIVRRARRQRRAMRAGLSAFSALALVAVVVAAASLVDTRPDNGILLEPGPQPSPPTAEASGSWSDTGAFTSSTDTVLLFDTGADRLLAVDLDAGVAARRHLEGQRAGDQPYRLLRTDDTLIVGWDQIYTVAISTGQSQLLGEATISVPAAEPNHVWLIDFASGRAERGTPVMYRLVTTDGEVKVEASGIEDHFPAHGIVGGLAVETEAGVAIWDAAAQDVVRRLGDGPGFVAHAHGRTVVWCEEPCSQLHVTDLDGDERTFRLLPESGEVFDARSARLSPDGRYVAAIADDAGPVEQDSAGTVLLLDLATGQVNPITPPLVPRPAYLGWTQDGAQLFFSSYGYGAQQTNVGRYLVAADNEPAGEDERGQLELISLPVGGTLSFVTLHQTEAEAFLEAAERLPGRSTEEAGDVPAASYDRAVELSADGTPLAGTAVITERFGDLHPEDVAGGESRCCLVWHPDGPALIDDIQKVLRVYPGAHSVGYSRAGLDVFSAAVLDSGAVALLGHRSAGSALVVLPLQELPDLTQASGPFIEPDVERINVPADADAVAAGHGGFWVRTGDGWTRVTDADGAPIDAADPPERLVLRDGSAVDADERADGSAVLHQETEGFTLRLELTVPDRRVSIQRIEAVDGPAPHALLVVLGIDGGEAPEHRLLRISGDTHVDYGTFAPGDTGPERLAIIATGELYHLQSDDVGVTVTRYTPDLARPD